MRDLKGWECANWDKSQNPGRGVRPTSLSLEGTVEPRYNEPLYKNSSI